jgi:type III secretory pathway component EscV
VFRLGEADDHAWVAPWNGAPGTWADGPPAPGDIDPADFVVRHLAACLFEALAEFADLSWTEQIMSQTDTWPQSIGALVRRTYRIETIAAVVEQMAGEQAALRDSRIVEALLDYPIEPRDARSLDAAASAATSPEVLGAYVRQRVGDAITFALADRWGPAPLALLELDRVDEDRLRGDIRSAGAPVPAYGVPDARGLLRSVASAVAAVPAGRHPALVTDLDVRRHVRRIIAAQWPMVPVLDRAQVDGTAEIVGRITFSST